MLYELGPAHYAQAVFVSACIIQDEAVLIDQF